ncbi:hypothetical protein BH09PLA1_BH09PLA1_13800 [soil metagenome]
MAIARKIAVPKWMFIVLALLCGGCMHDRTPKIPPDATLMTEGQKSLAFRAPESGTVYVYNRNNDKIVYSGVLERGQAIEVAPERNRITIEGRTVLEKGLDQFEAHRIFFKPDILARERGMNSERDTR